jgi:hypothetical protein
MKLIKLTLFAPLMLFSCNDPQKVVEPSGVTADELLQTLGGITFRIEIDQELQEGQSCGLAIKFADGSITPLPSSTGFKTGDLVKYVCIQPENGLFKFSFTADSHSSSGSSLNFPKFISQFSANSGSNPLNPGETISRYSIDDKMSLGEELEGDDFALIFYIHPIPDNGKNK